MRGLCKTDCECEVEYESHEFSDGFVYYLPRNLDGTVHNCIFSEDDPTFFNIDADAWDDFCQKHKGRLNIIPDELGEILGTREGYWMEPMDLNFMEMIKKGNMFRLKKAVEEELIRSPMPHFAHRSEYHWGVQDEDIELPTTQGYQLEYLGKIYELMIRLEDAKKCYELQYECTKEPELLGISKELDEKISKINIEKKKQGTSITVSKAQTKESLDETELKLREYIIKLFDNNFKEVWKRKPKLFKYIQNIRESKKNSLLPEEEESSIQHLSLGHLNKILKTSNTEKNAKFEESCKICKKSWIRYEKIFLDTINIENKKPQKIICIDKDCFVSQGGLWKDFPNLLIREIELINETRNALAHPEKYDKEMLHDYYKRAIDTCDIINRYVNEYLENKEFT